MKIITESSLLVVWPLFYGCGCIVSCISYFSRQQDTSVHIILHSVPARGEVTRARPPRWRWPRPRPARPGCPAACSCRCRSCCPRPRGSCAGTATPAALLASGSWCSSPSHTSCHDRVTCHYHVMSCPRYTSCHVTQSPGSLMSCNCVVAASEAAGPVSSVHLN